MAAKPRIVPTWAGRAPARNSIIRPVALKTSAVPRSGSLTISAATKPMIDQGREQALLRVVPDFEAPRQHPRQIQHQGQFRQFGGLEPNLPMPQPAARVVDDDADMGISTAISRKIASARPMTATFSTSSRAAGVAPSSASRPTTPSRPAS